MLKKQEFLEFEYTEDIMFITIKYVLRDSFYYDEQNSILSLINAKFVYGNVRKYIISALLVLMALR